MSKRSQQLYILYFELLHTKDYLEVIFKDVLLNVYNNGFEYCLQKSLDCSI